MWSIQAVLLDLDGTLLDTIPDIAAAANRLRLSYHLPELAHKRIETFVGKGVQDLVHKVLTDSETQKISEELHAEAVARYMEFYQQQNGRAATMYPNVLEGLKKMQSMQLPMAVVTNKPYAFTVPLLEQVGLSAFFKGIVGGDTCPEKKPLPGPLLYACEQLGVVPQNAVMIGDSYNDIAAAKAAGCCSLVLPYGYSEGLSVQSFAASGIVDHLLDAADWITPYLKRT